MGKKKKNNYKRFLLLFVVVAGVIVFGVTNGLSIFGGNSVKVALNSVKQSSDWRLILVNEKNPLPADYEPQLMMLSNGTQIDERIYPDLQAMLDTARKHGIPAIIGSAFRTQSEQENIMAEKIQYYLGKGYATAEAKQEAKKWVAEPGTSEHELGLALDINAEGGDMEQAVYQWLNVHSYEFGFIKRYPEDKVAITGISNEPWHYRYVGKDAAKVMHDQNLVLEEYLEKY